MTNHKNVYYEIEGKNKYFLLLYYFSFRIKQNDNDKVNCYIVEQIFI